MYLIYGVWNSIGCSKATQITHCCSFHTPPAVYFLPCAALPSAVPDKQVSCAALFKIGKNDDDGPGSCMLRCVLNSTPPMRKGFTVNNSNIEEASKIQSLQELFSKRKFFQREKKLEKKEVSLELKGVGLGYYL
jgi:hypothetical protein